MTSYPLTRHHYDVLIIGAGGAGLRAAVAASAAGARVAVLSKVAPTRSHTVAAQGGINAALGNREADDWRWHMYDTLKGADWLADEDAVELMCERAPAAITELEHMGMAFTRDDAGQIYQRAYGGQRTDFGKGGPAYRACAVADRTGHSLLHTLYSQAIKSRVEFFVEFIALDLLQAEDGAFCGVLAWQLENGEMHEFRATNTIIATGGFGQAYASTTASTICTGDGGGMALRAGIMMQDMEFIQFHPTGLYGTGILITEGARGEGAYLVNGQGERFMARYAPAQMELASRDVISRAMTQEIMEGRGCGPKKDYLHLRLDHLPAGVIESKLPSIKDIAHNFARLDITRDPVPVLPAVHYTMGGIPTDKFGRVAPGLFAIGEAACTSVHGANRLGCNALLELVVFGKQAGEQAAMKAPAATISDASREHALAHFDRLRHAKGTARPAQLRKQLQGCMQQHATIFRNAEMLEAGCAQLQTLWQQFHTDLRVNDQSLLWNNDLLEAIEADNLLLQAMACLSSANARQESRGAHWREDFPAHDDTNWRVHSLAGVGDDGKVKLATKAVRINSNQQPD